MTGEQLMGAILQSALQGKLVEQRPEEGTGEELYKKIKAEKERLIKAGLIKKTKSNEAITEDEKPFDIPASWKWTRIEDIAILNPKNNLDDDLDTSFIPMALVGDAFFNCHTSERRKWGEIKKGFSHFAEGDIGVAKITPCFQNRKSVIFKNLINGYGAGTTELTIIRPLKGFCCPEYLLYLFKSELFIKSGMKSFTGTAGQQRIHKDFMRRFVMPLPPLAEQEHIVAKIEELVPLVEQYSAKSKQLDTLNASFPEMMKKSILQEAVQGRLVPQNPNDEPASMLLKKIAEEKNRLVREGKIKKQKPLTEITDEEVPFEVPEGWEWVRIGMITDVKGGKRVPKGKSVIDEPTSHIYVRVTDMKNQTIISDRLKYITDEVFKEIKQYIIHKDDLYLTIAGTIGSVGKVPDIFDGMNFTENAVKLCNITIDKDFLMNVIQTPFVQSQFINRTNKVAQPKLAIIRIESTLIPLPPLAEQKRIVEKIDNLKQLCWKPFFTMYEVPKKG